MVDATYPRQLPEPPSSHGDALLDFVNGRIRWTESGPPPEAAEHRNKPGGGVIIRHAHEIRALCRGYRRIAARYGNAVDCGAELTELTTLRSAVVELAETWREHPEWRRDWGPAVIP